MAEFRLPHLRRQSFRVRLRPMNLTKNKWYRVIGSLMLVGGIILVVKALMSQGQPAGSFQWVKLGPVGLMCIIGGIGLLFLPTNIKL
jgi:hypothetical protein